MSQNSESSPVVSTKRLPPIMARSLVLFVNFLFIILAYYQVKSASRSLLIEYAGSGWFPYVWIFSAVTLVVFITWYHGLVERHSRIKIVLATILISAVLLLALRFMLDARNATAAIIFYVFVDIFSVVLVEQCWSLTNSITRSAQGRQSYWFVGSGGLVGGVLGGILAAALIHYTPMQTADLLYSCALLLLITLVLNMWMWRMGMYAEIMDEPVVIESNSWRGLLSSRYILLIATVLCLSQLAQPVVEYQFLRAIEANYSDLDQRTEFISSFFSVLGLVSIGVNLIFTNIIHRTLGVIAGLMVQPIILALFAMAFFMMPTLWMASIMKIGDRGLSYSINRASKEQLYIPLNPVQTYQSKAWIDMLGYRLFKVLGSGLILLSTQWLPVTLQLNQLSVLTVVVCVAWVGTIIKLLPVYRRVMLAIG